MEGLLDARMPVGSAPVAATGRSRGWAFLLLGLLVAGGGSFLYQSLPHTQSLDNPTVAKSTEISGNSSSIQPPNAPQKSGVEAAPVIAARPNESRRGGNSSQPLAERKEGKTTGISGKMAIRQTVSPGRNTSGNDNETPRAVASVAEKAAVGGAPAAPHKAVSTTPVSAPAIPEISGNHAPVLLHEAVSPLDWVASRAMDVFSGKMVNRSQVARVENYLTQWAAGENNPVASNKNWSAKIPENAPVKTTLPPIVSSASPASLPAPARANPASTEVVKPMAAVPAAGTLAASPVVQQKVEDAIEELRSARYTIGLLAGINSTLSGGSGALQGLHAGIFGLLKLSEKWHIGAGLHYAYRLNNSMDLKDDYFSGRVISEATVMRNGRPYNALRYEIDSMLSRYSFTSYSSLELPLQLRYEQKRFSVYGGPNIAFHFAPAVTRTDTRIATISRYDTLDASLPLPTLPGRTSDVSLSDFDNRFSLGYNVGAQYRLTPALRLDLRLSQQLWDNRQSHSAGSRRVSETYLHIPSLQLSVGYFFQQKQSLQQKRKP